MLCYDVYMYYMYCYSHDMSQAIITINNDISLYHSLLLYKNIITCQLHDMSLTLPIS